MKRITVFVLACFLQIFSSMALQAQTASANNNAKVIFYRSSSDGGKPYALTSKNQALVKLKKGEQFEQALAPGTYYYMADPSTKQVFKLDIAAGKTYYIKASRDGNFFNGKPILQISSQQEYERDLSNTE
jgi:hypothetical protein